MSKPVRRSLEETAGLTRLLAGATRDNLREIIGLQAIDNHPNHALIVHHLEIARTALLEAQTNIELAINHHDKGDPSNN